MAGCSMTDCPACSAPSAKVRKDLDRWGGIFECKVCGAIFGGGMYRGDSYQIVKPFFADKATEKTAKAAGTIKYFDLMVLGGDGYERRHGWFDTTSGLVTQVG